MVDYMFNQNCCNRNSNKNYGYLLDILEMIKNDQSLLHKSDNEIWNDYKQKILNAPNSSHQLPGLAKAIHKGGFFDKKG